MQKTTLFLVLVALALGGYVYFYEIKPQSQEETATESEQGLFSFTEEQVQRLTIKREAGDNLEFIRLETSASSWRMKRPEGTPAEEGAIVFLLDLLIQESSPKTFEVAADQLEEYGLKNPLATINIELENNEQHQVILGNPTFNENGIYGQINPQDNQQAEIYILPINFQDAVERPLSAWKLVQPSQAQESDQ
jgi:hypothetical protein